MGVLIIDDATFMRMTMKRILNKYGVNVVGEAVNGKVGVKKYIEINPKVVIMDITMPEMSGIDSIKEILKIDPQAKIIACSSMGQEDKVMDAIRAGARSFVVKPFQDKRLVEEVNKLLQL